MIESLKGLRRHAYILAVLAVSASLYFVWSHNDALGKPFADGPNYMMMAEHYSLYGHSDPVYAEVATDVRFPPLYPMLLALSTPAATCAWPTRSPPAACCWRCWPSTPG